MSVATTAYDLRVRSWTEKQSAGWETAAIAYGVVLITLAQMPVFDETIPGALIRYGEIGFGIFLVASNLPLIAQRTTGAELAIILAYYVVLLISTISGTLNGVESQPFEVLKRGVVEVTIFLSAKMIVSEQGHERYFRWFTYVCLFAAIQAVPTVLANFLGIRGMHTIVITGVNQGGHTLSWWGLLGTGTSNFRANFYYSEASYFAQMLIPGIIYAIANRRGAWLFILMIGFLTTFAAAAGMALAIVFLVALSRFRLSKGVVLCMAGFGAIFLMAVWILFTSDIRWVWQFLDRSGSVTDKLNSLSYVTIQLQSAPLGLGPINLPDYFGTAPDAINAASSLVDVTGHYGFPGLVLAGLIVIALLYLALSRSEDWRVSALALGSLGVFIATATHGPFIKYYALFMCSAAFGLRATLAQRPFKKPGETLSCLPSLMTRKKDENGLDRVQNIIGKT